MSSSKQGGRKPCNAKSYIVRAEERTRAAALGDDFQLDIQGEDDGKDNEKDEEKGEERGPIVESPTILGMGAEQDVNEIGEVVEASPPAQGLE
ncbi:MAG: hypothetical protein M1826_002252 [Phylliscum demangeonii]|nr:MAG: hypothetical protein M1826_002252 [Phylliscum demangeonii]